MEINLDQVLRVYLKIRNKKAELVHAHDAQIKELDNQLDMLKHTLLEYCKETNQTGGKADSGSFYRSEKTRYWTNDWDAMGKFVVGENLPDFYEKRLNQGVVKQYIEDNPQAEIPGLNSSTEYTITVKKPS